MTDARSLRSRLASAWNAYWLTPAPILDLGIGRVIVCALALRVFMAKRYVFLSAIPDALWDPLPFVDALGIGPPTAGAMRAMTTAMRASLWLALFGVFANPALLLAVALLVVLEGTANSFGKVGHGSIPILWALLFFGLAPCDRAFSLRRVWGWLRGAAPPAPTSRFAGWPFDLTFVEMSTFYLGAGLSKLRDGGLAWMDGATIRALLRPDRGELVAWAADSPWVCAALATGTVLFELGAVLGVVRSLRPWVLAAGVAFHVGARLLMGILFLPLLGLYLLFLPWGRWASGAIPRSTEGR